MSRTWSRTNAQMATPEIRWNAHASIPSPPRYCRYRTGRLASVTGRGTQTDAQWPGSSGWTTALYGVRRAPTALPGCGAGGFRQAGIPSVPVARALSGTGTRAPDPRRPGGPRCRVPSGRAPGAPDRGARSRATIGPHTGHRLQHPAPPDPDAGAAVKIQEADAKSLLAAQGLPVPPWAVARTAVDARAAAARLLAAGAGRVVIKAQVLVGGRGKAGGVRLAGSPAEAEEVAGRILGMQIKGIPVRKVLVGPAAVIVKEFYLGAILDRASRRIVLMASAEGGVEIEEVAKVTPEAIHRVAAHPLLGLLDWQARELAFAVGLAGPHLRDFVKISRGIVATMRAYAADLVEVNPLAIIRESGPEGHVERLACLDAKVTLDDSALPRHPDLEKLRDLDEEDPADAEARHYDISFIHLDGSIGCMVNGAGLAMTTMDLVNRAGGAPANFLDIGGGAKADRVSAAMRLILADPKVRAILVNIFGGITRGDEVARGLIDARARQEREVPMVVRIVGTNAEEAARLLREAAFETAATLDEAAAKAVAAARLATGGAA